LAEIAQEQLSGTQSKTIHIAYIVKGTRALLSTDIQPSDPGREQSSHIERPIIEKEKVSS
jgi:hypothetical protein